jgi:hypothetical protein
VLFQTAASHTWVEQLLGVAPNGSFTGSPGYIRNYTQRTVPNFDDGMDLNLVPPDGRANQSYIAPTDPMCNPNMITQVQSPGNPRLQAAPGAPISLQYQENGHVTLPQNQPGKPANRGTVYIYGTTQPLTNEYLLTVHRNWTADGTGGDKRGKLLSTQNFDDGQCYQVNSGNISEARQQEYTFTPTNPMGTNLWCQNDLVLPTDAPTGQPYTLYWVWDWPTLPGVDPSIPEGKEEIYTSCMDIDIIAPPAGEKDEAVVYVKGQQVNNAGVSSYMASIATGNNIFVTTPLNVAVQTAAPSITSSVSITSTSTLPESIATSPLVTVYPVTTIMTTVLLTPSSATTSVANGGMVTTTVMVVPTVTVTMTMTETSAPLNTPPQPEPNSPVASAPTGSSIMGAATSTVLDAPSTYPTTSAIADAATSSVLVPPSTYPTASAMSGFVTSSILGAPSTYLTASAMSGFANSSSVVVMSTYPTPTSIPIIGSNCTNSKIRKRSRILGANKLEERASEKAPIAIKRRARVQRSAKFDRV